MKWSSKMQIFIFNAFLSQNPVIGKLALEKLCRGQKFFDHSMQQKTKKARMSKMSLIVGNRIKIKKTSDCFLPLKQFLTDSFPCLLTACFEIIFVLWQLVYRAHSNSLRVCVGQVVDRVDCRPRGLGFNYCPFQTFFNRTCLPRICLE